MKDKIIRPEIIFLTEKSFNESPDNPIYLNKFRNNFFNFHSPLFVQKAINTRDLLANIYRFDLIVYL